MQDINIIVDVYGNDNGTESMIKGAISALDKHEDVIVTLSGDENEIQEILKKLNFSSERLQILNAPDKITNYDSPMRAVFAKPDSSMIKGIKQLAENENYSGIISSGNTGVLLVGCMRHLNIEKGQRLALCAVLPTVSGGFTCLVDTGATVDCSSAELVRFAYLGNVFIKTYFGIENPRIGLLSNGAESSKGNKLVKETHAVLKDKQDINFVGNVEGNVALSGCCDVLVCDGFDGNQVLKVTEGTASRIIADIVKYAKQTQSEEIMKLVKHLAGVYDLGSLGGGYLLGTTKPVVKIRGNSGEQAVASAVGMIINGIKNKPLYD